MHCYKPKVEPVAYPYEVRVDSMTEKYVHFSWVISQFLIIFLNHRRSVALNTHQNCFGWSSALDPADRAFDAPLDPVGWGGGRPIPILLPLNAFVISIWAHLLPHPQYKFLATVCDYTCYAPCTKKFQLCHWVKLSL